MKKISLLTILFIGAMIMSHNALAQDIPDATTDLRINHEVRDYLKSLGTPGSPFLTPFYALPGDQPRTILSAEQDKTPVDMSGVTITEKVITEDDRKVKIYIMKPQHVKGTPPVLFFIHGGVWLVGNFDNHKRFVRDLVVGSGAIAVFPEYTPLPAQSIQRRLRRFTRRSNGRGLTATNWERTQAGSPSLETRWAATWLPCWLCSQRNAAVQRSSFRCSSGRRPMPA